MDRRRGLGGLEGGADVGEFGRPAGVGQEAEVADAAEATGQDMQQEPADELEYLRVQMDPDRWGASLVIGLGSI